MVSRDFETHYGWSLKFVLWLCGVVVARATARGRDGIGTGVCCGA